MRKTLNERLYDISAPSAVFVFILRTMCSADGGFRENLAVGLALEDEMRARASPLFCLGFTISTAG